MQKLGRLQHETSFCAVMWAHAFRAFNHAGQHTTNAVEGYHHSLKRWVLAERSCVSNRTIPWLIDILTTQVSSSILKLGAKGLCVCVCRGHGAS